MRFVSQLMDYNVGSLDYLAQILKVFVNLWDYEEWLLEHLIITE